MPQADPAIRVLEAPLEDDLGAFSRYLSEVGIPHRFHEEAGKQVLVVAGEAQAARARESYEAYRAGHLELGPATRGRRFVDTRELLVILRRLPVTCALIVLCVLTFPVTWGDPLSPGTLLRLLAFSDFQIVDEYLRYPDFATTMRSWQVWRLWTPALLHFGALHLIFNMLVLWLLAPRIEMAFGGWRLLTVLLIVTPVSNAAQYFVSNWPLFGGMSGAVYGLLGYLLIASRYLPYRVLQVPSIIVVVMLVSLVLFSFGILELFDISVANGAHWSGLGAGLALGSVFTWHDRRRLAAQETREGDGG